MSKEVKTNKNDFKFVGPERKVYDQQIEGKPIGYFKDAFIRFRRNRMNVAATLILVLLIMMAIFVPILTTKNYKNIEEQLTYLTPRVPILEKLGILDGKKNVKKELVDPTTVDANTGLGLPTGYDMKYVTKGSLQNFPAPSNDAGESSLGGEVVFTLSGSAENYVVMSDKLVNVEETGTTVEIDVKNFTDLDGGKLEVYIIYYNKKYVLGTVEKAGVHKFNIELPEGRVSNRNIYLELTSPSKKASVSVKSLKVTQKTEELDVKEVLNDSAFSLYSYKRVDGQGNNSRINNYSIYAKFEYDQYNALFSSRLLTIGGDEYQTIRANNPTSDPIEDPDNPGQMIFEDGYVIKRIISEEYSNIGGEIYSTYQVEVDYAKYMGYKNIPYFIFGTDASGKDLFALTWVGLRTSLIIGVIVSIINISFGVVYGAISGYYGGKVDLVMERFTEIIGRIPWLVTLSIFTALIGPGFLTLIIILIISGWIGVASVTRTQFYRYKNREYVLASRTLGAKDGRLIFRHILPNGIGTIITSSILMIPGVIFSESSISYLGFGIGHGQDINFFGLKLSGASLGVLLADGQAALLDFPHLTIYPALIISILMITFNMFGNGLRDAFNPSLRGTE